MFLKTYTEIRFLLKKKPLKFEQKRILARIVLKYIYIFLIKAKVVIGV